MQTDEHLTVKVAQFPVWYSVVSLISRRAHQQTPGVGHCLLLSHQLQLLILFYMSVLPFIRKHISTNAYILPPYYSIIADVRCLDVNACMRSCIQLFGDLDKR